MPDVLYHSLMGRRSTSLRIEDYKTIFGRQIDHVELGRSAFQILRYPTLCEAFKCNLACMLCNEMKF